MPAGIMPLAGSPQYEEMVRRSMVNSYSGGSGSLYGKDPYNATNPLVNPTYGQWQELANRTGQNYGIIDTMLKNDSGLASRYGASSGVAGSGAGGAGGGGYGGIDPELLASINRDYDRSRLSTLANSRTMEKRMRGDFNERFGGAETGFLTGAEQEQRRVLADALGQGESNRNRELALARERAEERALRAKEAEQARIDRQRQANASAYASTGGAGSTWNPTGGKSYGGSQGYSGYGSSGGVFGAQFGPTMMLPGGAAGGGGGGGGAANPPPPGAPGYQGPAQQNPQQGGGGGGGSDPMIDGVPMSQYDYMVKAGWLNPSNYQYQQGAGGNWTSQVKDPRQTVIQNKQNAPMVGGYNKQQQLELNRKINSGGPSLMFNPARGAGYGGGTTSAGSYVM